MRRSTVALVLCFLLLASLGCTSARRRTGDSGASRPDASTPVDGGGDGGDGDGGDGGDGGDSDDGGRDGGPAAENCPFSAPDRAAMMGSCCYRQSNADRLDAPELRLAAFNISQPRSLANVVVSSVLTNALDTERFNWLLQVRVIGSDAAITTGHGVRSCAPMGPASCVGDSTYAFDVGGTYPPVTIMGSMVGENLSAPPARGSVTLPVLAEDGVSVQLLLPLENLELQRIALSQSRTCIGQRRGASYVPDGELSAFITVESAMAAELMVGALDTTLCMLIAGNDTGSGLTCRDTPQGDWLQEPDSLCTGSPAICTLDTGDGAVCRSASTCNAWFMQAAVAGHGVDIIN